MLFNILLIPSAPLDWKNTICWYFKEQFSSTFSHIALHTLSKHEESESLRAIGWPDHYVQLHTPPFCGNDLHRHVWSGKREPLWCTLTWGSVCFVVPCSFWFRYADKSIAQYELITHVIELHRCIDLNWVSISKTTLKLNRPVWV